MGRPQKRIEEWRPPHEYRCRHCGELIWQGMFWKHKATDEQQCADGRAFAEPRGVSWHPPGGFW